MSTGCDVFHQKVVGFLRPASALLQQAYFLLRFNPSHVVDKISAVDHLRLSEQFSQRGASIAPASSCPVNRVRRDLRICQPLLRQDLGKMSNRVSSARVVGITEELLYKRGILFHVILL